MHLTLIFFFLIYKKASTFHFGASVEWNFLNFAQIFHFRSYKSNYLPTHGQGEKSCLILLQKTKIRNILKMIWIKFLPAGVPTVVKTNILIRSMGPISELDMEYSMDCYFRQYWRDSRLKFEGPMKTLSLSIKVNELFFKLNFSLNHK